jgi:hypothetical protein
LVVSRLLISNQDHLKNSHCGTGADFQQGAADGFACLLVQSLLEVEALDGLVLKVWTLTLHVVRAELS